ncbi:MAG: TraR/DksA family transcriptional regulator [Actinomycetota bacterium]|nr:TraR/DksA family transcriptional regulator [Actinomycetota bacterium]
MQKKATKAATAKSATKAAKDTVGSPTVAGPQPAGKAAPAKKAVAKTAAKGAPPEDAGPDTVSKLPAGKPAKEDSKTVAVKKAEAPATKKATGATKTKVKADRAAFFAQQKELLLEERQSYMSSAEALKAQADSLALEHEPGDVQFDEEGGEGGTANVDREIDLYLSSQARATVVEIDRALQKIDDGAYGICEQCGDSIPDARLQALPYAALCVTCKSGGLSSRR